ADIFLTCLLGFALAVLIALFSFPKTAGERTSGLPSRGRRAAAGLLFAAGPVLFDGSRAFLSRLVAHANLNLFRFDFSPAFLLLQTGLFFVLAGTVLLLAVAFRAGSRAFRSAFPPAVIAALSTAAVVFLRRDRAWAIVLLQILVAALFLLWASGRPALRRAAAGALIPVLALFVYAEMERATRSKTRALAEGILKETVLSHAHSIEALLAESLDDLDAEDREIRAFLRRSETTSEAARRIWERTAAAKLNAYSGLQFFDADGAEAARFVLNVPKISSETESLPNRADWTIVRIAKPFMGKAREFLAGYRDWTDDGGELGRTVFYVSLDYDTLPFLYSANPYFELLRTNPLPSIEPFDIGFAVFDEQGRILFNPARLTTGLPPAVVEAAETSGTGLWSKFADNNRTYDLFSFRTENRIAAFLAPRKGFFGRSADLLKVSLLLAAFGLLTALFRPRGTRPEDRKHPLWSFSSRVYVSFIAVALAPLLLLAFVSRPFFNRLLTRQFVEKATIHANMARNAMDDFVYLQEERRALVDSQPEDLALFLSTSISNDVNLFMEGRLVSSSRREYFDAGLLPDLLDGEIYYKLRFANDPFTAQTRRLGGFSYQVLTVPYTSLDPPLLISLPFPFERQEIGEATRSLVDLLLVLSVFFVGLVALLARAIGVMIVTPIRRLLGGTKAVALGNLEFEVDYERRDEMKTLIDGFNGMIRSLKDHQRELADLGKKAAWAEMARKIAHEIKNPLTPIQLSAEHLLRVYEDQGADFETALRESTAYIIGEVENLRRIAQEFLELSKTAVLRRETFDLGAFIREIVEPYRKLLGGRIAFREAYDAEGRVSADKAKLKIAFRNIVINAVEAIRGRGEVRVTVSGSGDRVVTSFEDTGPGIEKEILDRIFEPYFSTKDVGTGLGLPIARKIVEDHDGSIRLESEAGRGTRVTIALPRSEG
ncbi:MAG: HAMP domain-containing protein, partial [Candidatus Aminicenantes bacterium]|nr:HAMP domain-containing protein [Candidatus Aminicenantes bacterium]